MKSNPASRTEAHAVRYSCRLCGATSYRRVVGRNAAGAIKATGEYQCSGCSLTFFDTRVWHDVPSHATVATAG